MTTDADQTKKWRSAQLTAICPDIKKTAGKPAVFL